MHILVQKSIVDKLTNLEQEKRNITAEINRISPEFKKVIHWLGVRSSSGLLYCSFRITISGGFYFSLQLEDALGKRNKEINKLEKRINEIVDRIYKDFSRSVGVANIREYEENQLKEAQSVAEERLTLSSQLAKLKYQ